MKTYLVGGAVRDKLLGLPVNDRDYVVVGATVDQMLKLGFKQVGAEFPVFLHPETGEEYALARQERKTGKGYHGFVAVFDEHTTLEDDLRRRDLTINAMAMDMETGELIDPFGGREDLKNGVLRHTSEAFKEDPVRVLRAARFGAKFGFKWVGETANFATNMAIDGELNYLTPERVFKELEKALKNSTHMFFRTLNHVHATVVLFPELNALEFVPAGPTLHHAEGSAFNHTMMVMSESAKFNNPLVTFGALVHDFGKAVTPQEKLPSHPGHEAAGVPIVEAFADRLRMPAEYKRVGMLVARHHGHVHKTFEMRAQSFVKFYNDFNKGHFEHDLDVLVKVAEADHFGRISSTRSNTYPEAEAFRHVMRAVHSVKLSDNFSVEEIKQMPVDKLKENVHKLKLNAAKRAIRENKQRV